MSEFLTKTGQQRQSFGEFDTLNSYKAGDSIIYDGNVWIANDDIPANTAFTPGSNGATWSSRVVGLPLGGILSSISNGATTVDIPTSGGDIEMFVNGNLVTTISAADSNITTNFGIGGNLVVAGNAQVAGNLQVQGNITYIDSNVVVIADKNIVLANNAANAQEANGGGFIINGANVLFEYNSTSNAMNLSHSLAVTGNVDAAYVNGEIVGATHVTARNISGATITKGQVVYVTGASGNNITVGLATNATEVGSSTVIGMTYENIADASTGLIATGGPLTGLDTSAFTEGALVFLDTGGAITATEPVAPAHLVIVGYVERSHATAGSIYIDVRTSWELGELHNVKLTSLVDDEILAWDSANSLWVNGTLDRGTY